MATSDTLICNQALQMIGTRTTIAAISEDSNEADQCRILYNSLRDQTLQMAFWNFAKKTATLSVLKTAPGTPGNSDSPTVWSDTYPPPGWLYEYGYPSDCLMMRQIVPQIQAQGFFSVPLMSNVQSSYPFEMARGARFEVATDTVDDGPQQNVILTNQYQAIGVYVMRVTNENLFSSLFVSAFTAALAAKLSIALTGDKDLAKLNFSLANSFIIEARAQDGNEGLTVIDNVPDWIAIREDDCGDDGYLGYVAPYPGLFPVF